MWEKTLSLEGTDYAVYFATKSIGLLVAVTYHTEGYEQLHSSMVFKWSWGFSGNYGSFCKASKDNTELSMVWEVLTYMYENFPREYRLWGCHHQIVHSTKPMPSIMDTVWKWRLLILECAIALQLRYNPGGQAPHTLAFDLGQQPPRKKGKMSVAIVADDDNSYSWSKNILYDGRKDLIFRRNWLWSILRCYM